MKTIISALLAFALTFSVQSQAQVIPNASFENWSLVLSSINMPDHWAGIVSQGSPGHTGLYFLNVTNDSINQGVAFTTSNYNYIEDTCSFGFACSNKPGCLSGSFKYNITGADSALIYVILYRGYYGMSGTGSPTMCGLGQLYITAGNVNTWTDFSVPITYFPPYDIPDSAAIWLFSSCNSNRSNSVTGNFLHIDNLNFCPSTDINVVNKIRPIGVYPNPVTDELFINGDLPANATFKIFNMLGQIVFEGKVVPKIDTRQIPNGVYWLNIISENNEVLSNFQIVKE